MNSNNTTNDTNGWMPFMNRKARRAAQRRARNRTITQEIRAALSEEKRYTGRYRGD
jgi:hypothetical protein